MDEVVATFFMENFPFFCYIHPNMITIIGLILNFVIYYQLLYKSTELFVIFLLLIMRWLIDTLDGAVARKYCKQSELGGYLDTLSDFIFFTLMFDYALKVAQINPWWNLAFIGIYWYTIYYYDSFCDHSSLKTYEDTLCFKDIIPFLVNNSIIPYLFIFGVVYFFGSS